MKKEKENKMIPGRDVSQGDQIIHKWQDWSYLKKDEEEEEKERKEKKKKEKRFEMIWKRKRNQNQIKSLKNH